MPSLVTLYGLPRSAYTRIVRLTLEEKTVPHQLEEVEVFGPGGVPAAHTKRHPFGRIPVLCHGDLSIYGAGPDANRSAGLQSDRVALDAASHEGLVELACRQATLN